MAAMQLAIFPDREHANAAITDLQEAGYDPKSFSIVTRDFEGRVGEGAAPTVGESTVSGATVGGALGALVGLLVGVGALALPGLGAVLIGGPLAAALGLTGAAATTASGAVTGAVAGGIVGALTRIGVPRETAQRYEERIKGGGVLLAVPSDVEGDRDAVSILKDNGAEDVREATV